MLSKSRIYNIIKFTNEQSKNIESNTDLRPNIVPNQLCCNEIISAATFEYCNVFNIADDDIILFTDLIFNDVDTSVFNSEVNTFIYFTQLCFLYYSCFYNSDYQISDEYTVNQFGYYKIVNIRYN